MSDDDKLSPEAKAARDSAPAFNALSRLISATIAGALIGWALDHFNVTEKGNGLTWGPVVGGVVGLAVFIYTALKIKPGSGSVPPMPPPPPDDRGPTP